MIQIIKRIFAKSYILRKFFFLIKSAKYLYGGSVENHGVIKIKRFVKGKNNRIVVGKNTYLNGTSFRIVGNDNIIEFGENVRIGDECSFWAEGNNITIFIGSYTHLHEQSM